MIKASIIGATGYAGVELVRILSLHPEVKLKMLTSKSYRGQKFNKVYPSIINNCSLTLQEQDIPKIIEESQVIFLALPHGYSVPIVEAAVEQGKVVIDLGADFRLKQSLLYERWYKTQHKAPELLKQAIYGLSEINRDHISKAAVVANPGCFPTGAILALAPVLGTSLIDVDTIIIDSKTGVSGGGRKLTLTNHYGQVNENTNPYKVASHRHTVEIEQEMGKLAGRKFNISFTPHLVPMTRGILTTIYVKLKDVNISEENIREIYQEYYDGEPFVHILSSGIWPHTKWVYGSNYCLINLTVDKRTNRLIVCSVIDNLVKGASGQAVQNMNILFDLPETMGLDLNPIYP